MSRRSAPWLALAVAAGAFLAVRSAPTAADDPPGKGKTKADAPAVPKPATVKVEKGPLTAAVTVKGIVEGGEAKEVSVRLKAWAGMLQVKKAIEHGSAVRAGDVLVEFDTEKIDLALRDARQERDLAELSIRQAELELPILERQAALDTAAARRDAEFAAADLKRFLDTDKALSVESAEFQVKSSNFFLEDSKDELKQLEKMYKDKDLTEETEQMILRRYRNNVERAEFMAKRSKVTSDQSLKVDIPRREITARDAVTKAEVALAKAQNIQPLALSQKKLALEKLRYEEGKSKKRLAELEQDREAMTVKAPAEGLAYHGRYVRGSWMVPMGMQGPKLLGGGDVLSGEVFLTVVAPKPLAVRAEVEEKELAGLKPDLAARVTPAASPDKKLAGMLTKFAPAPMNGRFEVRVELDGEAEGVVPGMSCSVRFVTAKKDAALTVPASAVFTDDNDDESRYVYRPAKEGGKPQKKAVKVGQTVGDRIEILDGLAEGDEILSAKP